MDSIDENEDSRESTAHECRPPPVVILRRQLEVCEDNIHANSNDEQKDKDNEEDSIDAVYIVAPDASENE